MSRRSDLPTFAAPSRRPEQVPGKIVVKVAPAAVRPHLEEARRARGRALTRALPDAVLEPVDALRRRAGLRDLQPLFAAQAQPAALRRARDAARPADAARLGLADSVDIEDDDLAGLAVATVRRVDQDVLSAVAASPAVEFAEPLPVRWLAQDGAADPMRNAQWGLRAIRWFEAEIPENPAVTVGVLDTGIDARHPDLAPVDITYDRGGFGAADIVGHGTHVAGIIAAKTNNDIGITGVAPCRLAVWKIFGDEAADDGEYYVDAETYYNALRAAGDAGLASLNLSIGGTQRARTEELLIARVVRRGVAVCAAMGNEYEEGDPTEYPAAFASVISVGAIAEDRRRSSFSSTGRHIDLVAPGSHILSTLPTRSSVARDEKDYASWSGTSMATPHVAAAAALVAHAKTSFGPAETTAQLRDTAAKLPAMRGRNWTQEYGSGLLNLEAALR